MKKILIIFLLGVLVSSCSNKYDGLVLTNKNTDIDYHIRTNNFGSYFIREESQIIQGLDTLKVFKSNGLCGNKFDDFILYDKNTNIKYLMVHSAQDAYSIYESEIQISGQDTLYNFVSY